MGTDVTNLVASFTLSPLSKAFVGLVEQVSGVSPNNFTTPVIYTVEAEDASTLDYQVTVSFNTGINNLPWSHQIRVYPNPFQDELITETPEPADRIEVVNVMGQVIDLIEKMTVLELADLSKQLQDKFGVSAAMPVAAAGPAAGG